MKKLIGLLVCGICLSGFSADRFGGQASIGSVQADERDNKAGENVLFLKFNTHQSGEPYVGILRVLVEYSEKGSERIFTGSCKERIDMGKEVTGGQFKGAKYTGAVSWEFEAKVDDLKRAKITAYAIQYGYEEGGGFHVLKEECSHVDSYEELEARVKSAEKRPFKRVYSMWELGT